MTWLVTLSITCSPAHLNVQTSNEVYGFSKLKRFLAYVNFMTQDTLRFLVQQSLDEFVR